jgi:hypothetical protein
MTVNLSILAGAAAQFFDNAGNVLTGGKIYTYAAGTTTPVAAYTTSAGNVAWSNPIILNAAGRVSGSGEIWLDSNTSYKFVLFDANNVLIGTYDDIFGVINILDSDLAQNIGYTNIFGQVSNVKVALDNFVKLTNDVTYYVRTDGNDSNTGLVNSSGGAFLTIQRAIDVCRLLNFNKRTVTISVQNGTYTAGVIIDGPMVGGGNLYIIGNQVSPSSVVVSVSSGDCFAVRNNINVLISGFKVVSATGNGVSSILSSGISLGAMDFGTCGIMHVDVGTGATVTLAQSYSVTGNAVGHLHTGSFGRITVPDNITVTLTGTPAFSAYFIGVAQGTVAWGGPTVVGSATGLKYLAHYGGLILTPGSFSYTNIPGSIAGKMDAWGMVVGSQTETLNIAPDIYAGNGINIQSTNFNAQTQNNHFVTRNDLFQGTGNFFCNGTDSYSTGRTNFCIATPTDVTTGTADGATFRPPGFVNLQMSNNNLGSLWLRRRQSDGEVVTFYRDTTAVGTIAVTTTATAYNTASDYRLKENDQLITGALEKIDALRPVRFNWKVDGSVGESFLAHELQEHFPQAVTGTKDAMEDIGNIVTEDGQIEEQNVVEPTVLQENKKWVKTGEKPVYQSVDSSFLIASMVAAIQELKAEIDLLKAK